MDICARKSSEKRYIMPEKTLHQLYSGSVAEVSGRLHGISEIALQAKVPCFPNLYSACSIKVSRTGLLLKLEIG